MDTKPDDPAVVSQVQEFKRELVERVDRATERSSTYTAVVIFGSYAGIFAIWDLTRANLSQWEVFLSAILMLVSIASFAGFEIFKTIVGSREILNFSILMKERLSAREFLESYDKVAVKQLKFQKFILRPVWYVSLILTILPEVVASCILTRAYILGLMAGQL